MKFLFHNAYNLGKDFLIKMQNKKSLIFLLFILVCSMFLMGSVAAYDFGEFIFPVGDGELDGSDGFYLSQTFWTGPENPIPSGDYGHDGMDLGGIALDPVKAVADGVVTYNGYQSGWGNCIWLEHENTSYGTIYTLYAHLDSAALPSPGDPVLQGETIGYVGNTGVGYGSTGYHLHLTATTTDYGSTHPGGGYYAGSMPSTHLDPMGFMTDLYNREQQELTHINPFSGQSDDYTVFEKMGTERVGPVYVLVGTNNYTYGIDAPMGIFDFSDINYDSDNISLEALVQYYTGDSDEGAVIIHPDSLMAVELDNNHYDVWMGNPVDSSTIVDSSCNAFFASYYGTYSEMELPITGVYYNDDEDIWRQDFQGGFMYRDVPTGEIHCDTYDEAGPGWTSSGWNAEISPHIVRAYERNGASEIVGSATDDGDGAYVYSLDHMEAQFFDGGENDENVIIYSSTLVGEDDVNIASVVRAGFWQYYDENDGDTQLGAPLGDELNVEDLRGYDPVCDVDEDGWID